MNNTVLVRYIVNDVDSALDSYTTQLGFAELMHRASPCWPAVRCALRCLPLVGLVAADRPCPMGGSRNPAGGTASPSATTPAPVSP